MKTLLIFDSFFVVEKMNISLLKHGEIVYLFPLTSQSTMLAVLEEKLKRIGSEVKIMQTARMINAAAEDLRNKYIRFIAELPKQVWRKQRDLKELFAIDKHTSLWWFSLIAEKNTHKSDSFNRLAQLDSIVQVAKREKIDKILFGCQSKKLKSALYNHSCKSQINFKVLPTEPICGLKMCFRNTQKLLYFKHITFLISALIRILAKTQAVKKQIGSLKRTIPQDDNSLLFFTYYPNIDELSAEKAIFKDKFYLHLQESLEKSKRNINWVAMYVPDNSISFNKSLEYAREFIKSGYIIFFLEEFISLGLQIKALFTVLKSGVKFLLLEKSICRAHNFGDYDIYPLFRNDWYSSFVGETGYQGVMYYYIFMAVLKNLKVKKYLYLCEMHAWEKALISARNALGIETPIYGYQSATVSRMLLNYFNYPKEVSKVGNYVLPQPDKIVCNGRLPYICMQESGWPEERLAIVEALRYSHLKKKLNSQTSAEKQNIVLVAFSIGLEESSSILNIVYEAFKDRKDTEVWLRPHPSLRLERIFELLGISARCYPFKVKHGELDDILSKARVVVAGESSVAIEAVAYGCDVVIVEVPEWINMSPLKGMNAAAVKSANSPQSLQEVISNIFHEEHNSERRIIEARRIINNFFYLNQASDVPKNFLKLLMDTNG